MWRDALLEEIRKLKGDEVAKHFDAVLLPSILADFLKEIMKKGNAREDYNIDNGITLTLVGIVSGIGSIRNRLLQELMASRYFRDSMLLVPEAFLAEDLATVFRSWAVFRKLRTI